MCHFVASASLRHKSGKKKSAFFSRCNTSLSDAKRSASLIASLSDVTSASLIASLSDVTGASLSDVTGASLMASLNEAH